MIYSTKAQRMNRSLIHRFRRLPRSLTFISGDPLPAGYYC
ncbi:hypothetical protein Lp90_0880 [Lactiplantibacillus plantarum]|nr:hypothetical protein LBP_cg0794 [Lactiplantibacillus plantarum subsp. plantarum P-8]KEZ15067.1 hypothetical protein Lp90_0880 [Lactiplantibacillus plantarum]KZD95771.1 hypothetical protein FBR6_3160 [Lactiplantibacillus plantarum]KZD95937.1 hypothetical protein FBR4_1702 [Lactiplantibacillus plantarum]KZT96265.1 hypothetical protein Nizo2257_1798 [Lactiplantibacillus plantarum]